MPPPNPPAPLLRARSTADSIPGKYIVKFKDDISNFSLNSALASQQPDHTFTSPGFKGFAAFLDPASLTAIRDHPDVEFVEEDSVVTIRGVVSQPSSPWNLARISSRTPGSTTYRYDESAGAGTCVYVIDSGVYASHPELAGRVVWGINTAGDGSDADLNGHGTAVAGVAGAVIHGVAKKTTIIAVKVINASGSGTTSGVIAGLSFVATDASTRSNCPNGTVANISLGGGRSTAMNAAAAALVNSGVFVSVAAGGSNDDAQFYSPASEPSVFTVGGTDIDDLKNFSSNYGELVDLFAPATDIEAPWIGGGNLTETLSGTSFSAAHVSGLAAYFLGLMPNTPPVQLGEYIQSIATKDAIKDLPVGTKNLLAYNGIDL
ncbi:peptidase S8/S53 domain-containing protein [Cercophora newfieldiana]|uniref:Peptidase S8/S53 domain-containing protein n=1 Tax=Cercophora newfieldiana TaxID=92897 RepID=A0AA39YM82_9PEZI|nr:peptidase S8/S53 domain-containing protein [Cercophora newfieldiana]